MDQFLIGNILVELDYSGVPVISEGNLRRFHHEGPWDGDRIRLDTSVEPLSHYLTPQYERENHVYGIYSHQNEPVLSYHWGKMFHGFAVWPERFAVTFDPGMLRQTPLREDWFFSICAFHRQLLLRGGCVLHASYVDIGGEAILFTGPSNIGKSTQAALWTKYRNARVINGDRVVLRKKGDRWHAFGYPSCGTSGICINRDMPVRAIVVLSQAPENRMEPISAAAKIRALTAATELYPWDQREFDMALDVASRVSAQVPVLKLCCLPDEGAVNVLKNCLEGLTP